MKKILLLAFLFTFSLYAQQAYYNDVNLTLTGINLKNELATKITNTHSNNLSYNDAREALKIVDLDPGQGTNVLLIYGFASGLCPANSSNNNDHRLRNKADFGGSQNCEWNREHTYPKGLGTPNLGTSGPGADAHHLRAADVHRNGDRGNKLFGNGSGNSGAVGSNWYPGDEWKGDIARMMMYMYLRYGSQCLPKNVCVGSINSTDSNMINLLLQWNTEDPVSPYEDYRNNYLGNTSNQYGQGNRNPFIDNPYLATIIWGGQAAEDRWGIYLGTEDYFLNTTKIYPNPATNSITIQSENNIKNIKVYNNLGQLVLTNNSSNKIDISPLEHGIYFVKIISDNNQIIFKKLIKE